MRSLSLLLSLAVLAGCSSRVVLEGDVPRGDPTRLWLRVLDDAVTEDGLVDYDHIESKRDTLHRYLRYVGEHGPGMDGWGESKERRRLAFMMNAYNAAVIEGVLRHQPLQTVQHIGHPLDRVRPGAGFFLGQRFRVDGDWQTLYILEHQDIVGRYQNPLAHVGLNCASRSCPPLRGWTEEGLNDDLERAMTEWVQADGLQCDDSGCRASALFDWYRDDFLDWSFADTLCGYLADFATGDDKAWLEAHEADCPLQFQDWDWSLNAASTEP